MKNSVSPLTGLLKASRLGRPELISDSELARILDELSFALDQNWALVGWDLQCAKTPRDLQRALKRIRGFNCEALEVFRKRLTLETRKTEFGAAKLQGMRTQLEEAREHRLAAFRAVHSARQEFENLERALSKLDDSDKYLLQDLRKDRKANLVHLESRWREWEESADSIAVRMEQLEALFAQYQVLDFIASKRYKLTPYNFAAAMAGLPYIAWQQSRKRCTGVKRKKTPCPKYDQFEIIAKACPPPLTRTGDACRQLRDYLLNWSGSHGLAIQELAKYWRFLRLAAESLYPALEAPRAQLPFLLFKDFRHQIESQSESDAILAENERLEIGKKRAD